MPVVFINYRVEPNHADADVLYDEFGRNFGSDSAFMASRSIRPGNKFNEVIDKALRECQVLLAIVGPRWSVANPSPRMDWVHFEINSMLRQGKTIIPILIEEAKMPDVVDLPPDIKEFAHIHGLPLHHYALTVDLARIVAEVERTVPALSGLRQHKPVEDPGTEAVKAPADPDSEDHSGPTFKTKVRGKKNEIYQADVITFNGRNHA
jgi:hypothetical protein